MPYAEGQVTASVGTIVGTPIVQGFNDSRQPVGIIDFVHLSTAVGTGTITLPTISGVLRSMSITPDTANEETYTVNVIDEADFTIHAQEVVAAAAVRSALAADGAVNGPLVVRWSGDSAACQARIRLVFGNG